MVSKRTLVLTKAGRGHAVRELQGDADCSVRPAQRSVSTEWYLTASAGPMPRVR